MPKVIRISRIFIRILLGMDRILHLKVEQLEG